MAKPNGPIINCEEQLTELKCIKCSNGFYNTNENLFFCVESTHKEHCLKYKSKEDGCKECSEGFTAVKGACTERVYSKIENCDRLKGEGEGCGQCKTGYVGASDGLGCLQKIPKCRLHQKGMSGLKGRLGLGCFMCEDGYFIEPELGHVGALGTVTPVAPSESGGTAPSRDIGEETFLQRRVLEDSSEEELKVLNTYVSYNSCQLLHEQAEEQCAVYSRQGLISGNEGNALTPLQKCQQCVHGYYLTIDVTENPCLKYLTSAYEGCARLSGFLERKCLWCDYQSILMKTYDLCLPPIKSSDCLEYQSPTQCRVCKDGSFNEDCMQIPTDLHCLAIEGNGQGLDLSKIL